jgi:hypothetical protein
LRPDGVHRVYDNRRFYWEQDDLCVTWIDRCDDAPASRSPGSRFNRPVGEPESRHPVLEQALRFISLDTLTPCEDRPESTLKAIWHARVLRNHEGRSPGPLADVLGRYCDFFKLFGSFKDYTDFFLLQDLVSEDASTVRLLMRRFDGFGTRRPPA